MWPTCDALSVLLQNAHRCSQYSNTPYANQKRRILHPDVSDFLPWCTPDMYQWMPQIIVGSSSPWAAVEYGEHLERWGSLARMQRTFNDESDVSVNIRHSRRLFVSSRRRRLTSGAPWRSRTGVEIKVAISKALTRLCGENPITIDPRAA